MWKHDCNFYYGKTINTDLKDGIKRMKYCPVCGKLLGHIEPLKLKELEKLSGKPVYIICDGFPNLNGWYVAVRRKKNERMDIGKRQIARVQQ